MLSTIRSHAINLLTRREHSKFELQQKLSKMGFALSDIEQTIDNLVRQGLQSDERFVEGYVNMRIRKGFGPVRIGAELQERGIDKEQGERFLVPLNSSWLELARRVRCKKFGKQIPQDLHRKIQQMRYLYYKGFTNDQIKETFNHEKNL